MQRTAKFIQIDLNSCHKNTSVFTHLHSVKVWQVYVTCKRGNICINECFIAIFIWKYANVHSKKSQSKNNIQLPYYFQSNELDGDLPLNLIPFDGKKVCKNSAMHLKKHTNENRWTNFDSCTLPPTKKTRTEKTRRVSFAYAWITSSIKMFWVPELESLLPTHTHSNKNMK